MAKLYRIGTSTFTFAQREFLFGAIGRGYSRAQTRTAFQALFGRGFRNTTFTAARRVYETGKLIAARANLTLEQRTGPIVPQAIRVVPREYRLYQVTGKATVRSHSGVQGELFLNFYTRDNSLDGIEARAAEIASVTGGEQGTDIEYISLDIGNVLPVDFETAQSFYGA